MASEFENVKQAEPKTRIQRRKARVVARAERVQKQGQKTEAKPKKAPKKRLIPIWQRLLIVVLLVVISMTAGLMFGYGVIGDGNAFDALKVSTWQHLIDLVLDGVTEK